MMREKEKRPDIVVMPLGFGFAKQRLVRHCSVIGQRRTEIIAYCVICVAAIYILLCDGRTIMNSSAIDEIHKPYSWIEKISSRRIASHGATDEYRESKDEKSGE